MTRHGLASYDLVAEGGLGGFQGGRMLLATVRAYFNGSSGTHPRVHLNITQMLGFEIPCKLLFPPGRRRTDMMPTALR